MKAELWAVALVIVATVVGAFGALFFKLGSETLSLSLRKMIRNYKLIAGFALYGISAIFFIFGLKGGELSVLYPLVSLGYVWICFFSIKFLKESMGRWKWLGIFFIILGVSLIGVGS